jgi:arsenate reductase
MAEAFLRELGGEQFVAFSAGLEPKGLHPLTVQVMAEIGYDLSRHRSKGVNEFLGKQLFHYIITVCDDADQNCPRLWPGMHQRLHWSFEDPAAFSGTEMEKLAGFRQVRDQIREKVRDWLDQFPQ